MILANVRGRLRAQDFLLVALALAHGDAVRRARYERLLLEAGPDHLLDEPDLLDALLALRTLVVPSPALFAYVAVRHALRAAGVDDRELADYLAALLLEFGDHDRHVRIGRVDDETYHYLVDMVEDLTGLDDAGERAFLLRVHLGNYSLWLAGLFPDYIAARRSRKGGPDLPYYDELGRQGFRLAAEHRLAEHLGVARLEPRDGFDVALRDDQQVDRRLRVQVPKRQDLIVLVLDLGGAFLRGDATEDAALGHGASRLVYNP